MNIIPFNPPQIKLMGPGPSDVYPTSSFCFVASDFAEVSACTKVKI